MTTIVPEGGGLDALYDECVERLARGEAIDLVELAREYGVPFDDAKTHLGALLEAAPDGEKRVHRLGEFEIVRELGAGGMGIVYLARQTSLGRQVALKVIKPIFSQSPQSRARFQREASAVARLAHPNIVAVHTAGEENGTLYLAMDYVEGRGLDELINAAADRGERIPINDSVRYAAQIARALEAAHKAGIVHRDVKPSNVRVTAHARAMLLDFGLARDRESIRLTMSGELQGSPYYMPPELLRGKNVEPDGRCDVYGLGVTLYESLTGRVPFEGDTLERVLHQILSDPPPPPRISNAALSKDLETVVLKALEKDPERRYQTAGEFADDLEALLAFRPIRAKPPGFVTRSIAAARRRPWVVVPAITFALVALGFAGLRIRDAAVEHRRLEAFVTTAEKAIEDHDFDAAAEAIASAQAIEHDAPNVLLLRPRLDTARREADAKNLFDEAAKNAKAHADSLAKWTKLKQDLAPLAAARDVRYLTAEQSQRLDRGEIDLSKLEHELDALEATATAAINRAIALSPQRSDLSPLLADLFFTRYASLIDAGESKGAITYREKVEQYDQGKRLTTDLRGAGSLALTAAQEGAEVHVFRFVDQSTLGETGERRLVPKPIKDLKPPKPFGAWVLAVATDSGGLRAGDLIVSIAGNAIRNTVLVDKGAGEVSRLDRLAAIDGRGIRDTIDVVFAEELTASSPDGMHVYDFEHREGATAPKKLQVKAKNLATLGIEVTSPAVLARAGGVEAEVWSDGTVRKMTLPEGVRATVTGTPLYACAATLCGTTPLAALPLDPGSYLALVRKDGFDDERIPFVVARKQRVELSASLRARGSAPEGFRFVPKANFTTGPDWRTDPPTRRAVDVEPFFMMEHEVTFAEYLEFLNDPAVRGRIASGDLDSSVVPRIPGDPRGGTLVAKNDDGSFSITSRALSLPVHGISFRDAQHYVDWRNARATASGSSLRFDLPRSSEWEFAARGADDRPLVCGDHFVANWLSSGLARPRAQIEPVMTFPVDESPFGIYDLAGSMNEWCRPDTGASDDAVVRGGAWDTSRPEAFRADYFSILPSASRSATIGFRLIARSL